MKKLLIGVIAIPFFLLSSSSVLAQVASPTTSPQQTAREGLRSAVQTSRTDYLATIQKDRELFRQKLSLIKDKNKEQKVDSIDKRLLQINTTRTTQMSEALSRLSTIIDTIATKTATVTPSPSASVTAAITTAKTKITTSQQAVTDQATKQYVITITTEANLGQSVRTTIALLQKDLQATHTTVLDAKTAVLTAIRLQTGQTVPTTTGVAN